VLMDCQMPSLNGFQATEVIRQRESETDTHLPIIALTAGAVRGFRELCLRRGMDDYLSKPFKPEELSTLIGRLLRRPSRPSPADLAIEDLDD